MEDRKASLIAAAFGSVAIGGFWFARPAKGVATLRVVAQWEPGLRSGLDADAAVAFRIEPRGALRQIEPDGRMVEYRLVDGKGRGYPLVPMADLVDRGGLKLVRGYPKALESPRIVALVDGRPLASVAIQPIPAPVRAPLAATPDAPLVLLSRGGSDLFVRPSHPIPADERWRVVARRTSYAKVESATEVGPLRDRSDMGRLVVPYASEAGLIEVEVTRYRLVPRSDVVRIPNLRLFRRFGGTVVAVAQSATIPNRIGATIHLPPQDNGPHRMVQHGDSRTAIVNLAVTPPMDGRDGKDANGMRRLRGPRIQILSPAPESLGLREIRLGGSVLRAEGPPSETLKEGEFSISARLTFARPVPIGKFRAVVPVRVVPFSGAGDFRYGSTPSAWR